MVKSSGLGQRAQCFDEKERKTERRKKENGDVVKDTTFEGVRKLYLRF
jgi:hypothetical protein